ncbi:unnamed protein product [Closterium sp. Yama58-4]|nr:unnamed protein product [Closterium sp. Yama58-4]
MAVWSAVSARMRGGITRISKTVLYRFLGIPRFVGGLPKEVQWKLVTCSVVRTPRDAYQEYLPDGFSMTWHCNEMGVPFSTWQFEIFIAAAYWRNLERKNLILHPYNVAFALYGAEYPVVHHDQYRTGLPTKDTPNIHNTDRMRAIVCNWMRFTILKWRTTRGGPRWIPSAKAWQFSEGTHYNVLIRFPSPEELAEMPEEIVGGEAYDGDDDQEASAQAAATLEG